MSAQQQLFDPADGQRRKERGKKLTAGKHAELLGKLRLALRALALQRADGRVTSDDAYRFIFSGEIGNAMGSVFNTDEWEFTGQRIKSKRSSAHAREIKVWRLR